MTAPETKVPTRTVYCDDSLVWLKDPGRLPGGSVITSLPDFSEFPDFDLDTWKAWFMAATRLVLGAVSPNAVSIFYQSDIQVDGAWVDKSYLIQKVAEEEGVRLLWHKVICRAEPGETTWGKPGFSHLLCFSKNLKSPISESTFDVLPSAGPSTWSRGMGLEACRFAAKYVRERTLCRLVVDPFCGHGTVLVAANEIGLDAIGVDLFPKRAKRARTLQLGDLVTDSTVEG